ncbi:uncharacterized protein EDB91DRAFT_1002071, partial [Suillus paluster]|uniref:uncharacterized protein n=1 Tax=Suillus paluster TaxID=48578 RepID=UPI001B875E20
ISTYTDVSRCQILRILALFRATGKVTTMTDCHRIGRHCHLTSKDVAFLHGSLDKTCDSYLDELKEGLEEICGVSVSMPTVWCALQRSGYSMKKV